MNKGNFTKKGFTAFIVAIFSVCAMFYSVTGHAQIINTYAGNGTYGYSGDGGAATAAQMGSMWGVAVDAAGNLYISDGDNYVVRKVDVSGIITTIAGNGTEGYSGDGGAATAAELDNFAGGMAVDAAGNIYIADRNNNCIRKINTSGIISTIAGNTTEGFGGDGGPATAAEMDNPRGITVDAAGNVYIADWNNNCIRKVDASGNINTIAGNTTGGYTGDGGAATAAELNAPWGIALDANGNLFIADCFNNAIREVNAATGIITTVLTGAAYGSDPSGVAFDASANLYIAFGLNSVYQMNTSGTVTPLAGSQFNNYGYSGDGGPAIDADFENPFGIAVGANGNVYIADNNNCVVRRITPPSCDSVATGTIATSGSNIFCGPGSDTLTLMNATADNGITYQWLSSADGTNYTNVGSDTIQYATGALTSTMYYKVIVTCTTASITDTTTADTITVNPVVTPTVSVTASPGTTVAPGQTVTYTATVTNGGVVPSYQWRKNGINIPGAAASTYATSALADNDIITCLVYSTAPCASPDSATSNELTMHISSGIASVNGNIDGIQMYPNPNNGSFTIIGSISNSKQAKIEVLNVMGQVVYNTTTLIQNGAINNQVQLSNDNANGIYMLRITTDNGSNIIRFIMER